MTTISSDVIRGYNDTMILYLLWDEPSYGYEISKQIKAMCDEKYCIKGNNPLLCLLHVWKKTVILPLLTATIPTLANAAPIIASQMPVEPTIMRNVPNGN